MHNHDLRERMKVLAHERPRFGYRRLHVLLRREGHLVNHKRLFRLYREEKLTVRKRGGRKRAIGTRAPMLIPTAANVRWSLDFVSDQLTDGRRFRVLTVVDDCTRECLTLVADTSLSGLRVARELDRIIERRGKPKMIVSDNGSEFTPVARPVIWSYLASLIIRRENCEESISLRNFTLDFLLSLLISYEAVEALSNPLRNNLFAIPTIEMRDHLFTPAIAEIVRKAAVVFVFACT
jgi:transposase InsO family protein